MGGEREKRGVKGGEEREEGREEGEDGEKREKPWFQEIKIRQEQLETCTKKEKRAIRQG